MSGHMAANMARNLLAALRRWPITSVNVWMDSMVALFWICNPGKTWKAFVSNRVRKIAEITQEAGIKWRYCPTDKNLADLGSRGASLEKMQKGKWFEGPEWLINKEEWPQKPVLERTQSVSEEHKPIREEVLLALKGEPDEWDALLERNKLWKVFRITAWALRFKENSQAKMKTTKKKTGPLCTEELVKAREHWVRRAQREIPEDTEKPGWKLVKEKETGILKCVRRIPRYHPTYIEDGPFARKLIQHVHVELKHLGVADTMAALRDEWWIPKLRALVKKQIRQCNVCKVFAAKPFGAPMTAALPEFRTEASRPFQYTGVDFAGPLKYKVNKREEKAYVLIFTCATSRAVHLELTRSQTAEEFQRKLNAFIARRTRPQRIISDNAATFKTTAAWIKKVMKSEELQDFLARQEIKWQFNLSKSPWWGGMYERLIKDIKKTLHKTLGATHLTFEQLEAVVIDIEKHMNNRPLTYVESGEGEPQVLTPNVIMWGQNAHEIRNIEVDEDETTKLYRRLNNAREHAWRRWKKEYVHGLMEAQRIKRGREPQVPEIGEIVLVVGEGKNRGEWMKAKMVRHLKGNDGVVRGVELLHKGNQIQRPLQLVCLLEIGSSTREDPREVVEMQPRERTVKRRKAAEDAEAKIKLTAVDD